MNTCFFIAENIAKEFSISREQQDEYAAQSQFRTELAQKGNKFAEEIVPVTVKERRATTIVDQDEFPKPGTNVASLSKLRPAFTEVS
jgi:acetyl-CoA C-acetyltransferase